MTWRKPIGSRVVIWAVGGQLALLLSLARIRSRRLPPGVAGEVQRAAVLQKARLWQRGRPLSKLKAKK
jgi:hypothetical protein